MIKMLLPVLFLAVGVSAGVGAGLVLAPSDKDGKERTEKATTEKKPDEKTADPGKKGKEKDDESTDALEYLKLSKQFVVPVVTESEISALVTMSLSLEVQPGMAEAVYEIEPKLRDGFLQVMFDHANSGGFSGAFTESGNLETLRKALLDVAQKDLGDDVTRILIMSVARQDS